ncbi:phage tail protein [Thauera sp. CAU 1555]|uniref:Phage tail protein n=1 Tax=Thauera sedimentorum TaxID=2767595 RepID=A0ABR9B8R8_9RHOO|nr:phage tail protein [Thauera sedimentorum]MBC9071834.1 phage tail protein [Thauera sedimentorum]MBD8502753.1 phage tail protein [Thauera sedimentorum]
MKAGIRGIENLRKTAALVATIPEQMQRSAVSAINRAATRIEAAASREMQGRVNLPPGYIRGKLRIVRASMAKPVGAIAIQRRAVPLARFGAQQLSAPAPRARGDRMRRIAKGHKQAGVSVQVKRGRKVARRAFLMPLLGGNGMGVFVRFGPDRRDVEHLYGPSPDQLFRAWRDDNLRRVQDELSSAFGDEIRRNLGSRR